MDNLEISGIPFEPQDSCKNYHTTDAVPLDPEKVYENDEEASMKLARKGNSKGGKYLGVRQRPSGRWVAEIKVSSQKMRLWLGTFDSAEEAAHAYDSAARLLRGRNAKTNFPCNGNMNTQEESCSLVGKNPRLSRLLHHAIMKNHARSSSLFPTIIPWENQISGNEVYSSYFDTIVEETIVCSSSSSESGDCTFDHDRNKLSEVSFGSSKVYSSVFVAPSFSASVGQVEEDQKHCQQAA